MSDPLSQLIAEIADQVDEFHAGAKTRAKVRESIIEFIDAEYFTLAPGGRVAVTDGVMSALEADEFFDTEYVGDIIADTFASDEN